MPGSSAAIRSMTGYGQATVESGGLRVTVELRGVNHRYADVRLRLPAELAAREAELRRKILGTVRRGRVDTTLNVERTDGSGQVLSLNRALVGSLTAAAGELTEEFPVEGTLDLATLLTVPGVIELRQEETTWDAGRQAAVDDAMRRALAAFDEERLREGAQLREDLLARAERMERVAGELTRQAAGLPELLRRKLVERVQALAEGVEIEPARLAQEAAFLADRGDVTEELVRLRGHLEQVRSLLAAPDGEPLGKRLDFLMQEVQREVNTVNSKSSDLELSRSAIELKTEAEKVREQIQNLE